MLGKGKPHTTEHVAALVANHVGMLGKHHSEESKKRMCGRVWRKSSKLKLAASHLGRKNTPDTKKTMSNSAYARWDRQHLLQSGFGHPWRLATLDAATRSAVENY
jgi:hypothetical protein